MTEIKCVAPTGDICGEAATWSASENTIYWVDINRFLIHRFLLDEKSTQSFIFDEPVVALSLTDVEGKLLVALASQLIFFTPDTDERVALNIKIPNFPTVRFNDGRTDPNGVFWVGSVGNNVGKKGENLNIELGLGILHRYKFGGELEEIEKDIDISNTVCWSPDQTRFYFGDTQRNEIRQYDFDVATSTITNGKPHFTDFDRGLPDGSTIDSDGYIWNCRFYGGCVVRVAPNGIVDKVIEMPVQNITTCAFGGKDLSTLFITTASAAKAESDRLAGSLFAIETDVQGIPENKFKTINVSPS